MILTILIAFCLSAFLAILTLRIRKPGERFIILLIYYLLLCLAAGVIVSLLLGVAWHPYFQIGSFMFITVYWMRQIWVSSFWGKLLHQTWLIVHLFIGGYIYAIKQMPYPEKPFQAISINAPSPLTISEYATRQISGLPMSINKLSAPVEPVKTKTLPEPKLVQPNVSELASWERIEPLMQKDSHIRSVMHQLKEEQDRALSELLANLNEVSASSTQMRRHALSPEQVGDLIKEQAISTARSRTMIETWQLLDHDEQAFRERQGEERFHALLDLLEDNKVDESYKVDFIRFMAQHFSGDVRLIKPLIRLYDRLDEEYPRQKRLNRVFMDLYIAKREALIEAFKAVGKPALQPLLDYRGKTVSHITYSQARLDLFLQRYFGTTFRPLYGVIEAKTIPDFLNRQKYPPLHKLSGASFEQDNIRRSLLALAEENSLPASGEPVMGLSEETYRDIVAKLPDQTQGFMYSTQLDEWLIHPDPAIRANLAWRLAAIKSPYALPLLFDLMKDQHPEVRRFAAIAVGNFQILDSQGANDQKFIEIIRMLQNYRSNSDSFARGWAVLALADTGDKQKALYAIDLLLNDGADSNSIVGGAATSWRSDEEREVMHSWIETLRQTPEDLWVKTQALNALIALDTPESLDVLLHYLHHVYAVHNDSPSLWRYIAPHLTLPQEAENVEDVVFYLAQKQRDAAPDAGKHNLKALRMGLWQAYENHLAGEFFQVLDFLRHFDPAEYRDYVLQNDEQIRIMRIWEYTQASYGFWLVCWPISLLCVLVINYSLLPLLSFSLPAHNTRYRPNQRANPASDSRNKNAPPSSAIVPIKIAQTEQ
ncbi:MAG: HEAT repeat domain-containing protein [Methylobacter sp.]|nr:MAG: HEAT repeat domain-containing protein [Methylobacter sp.]